MPGQLFPKLIPDSGDVGYPRKPYRQVVPAGIAAQESAQRSTAVPYNDAREKELEENLQRIKSLYLASLRGPYEDRRSELAKRLFPDGNIPSDPRQAVSRPGMTEGDMFTLYRPKSPMEAQRFAEALQDRTRREAAGMNINDLWKHVYGPGTEFSQDSVRRPENAQRVTNFILRERDYQDRMREEAANREAREGNIRFMQERAMPVKDNGRRGFDPGQSGWFYVRPEAVPDSAFSQIPTAAVHYDADTGKLIFTKASNVPGGVYLGMLPNLGDQLRSSPEARKAQRNRLLSLIQERGIDTTGVTPLGPDGDFSEGQLRRLLAMGPRRRPSPAALAQASEQRDAALRAVQEARARYDAMVQNYAGAAAQQTGLRAEDGTIRAPSDPEESRMYAHALVQNVYNDVKEGRITREDAQYILSQFQNGAPADIDFKAMYQRLESPWKGWRFPVPRTVNPLPQL